MNRYRDYLVEFTELPNKIPGTLELSAKTRVRDFWGGLYKQFSLASSGKYVIRIGRSHSLNTIVSGVFIDPIAFPASTQPSTGSPPPGMVDVRYDPPPSNTGSTPDLPIFNMASGLWAATEQSDIAAVAPDAALDRISALRAATASNAPNEFTARWRWIACLWSTDDRMLFDETMAKARDATARQAIADKAWQRYLEARRAGVKGPIKVDFSDSGEKE